VTLGDEAIDPFALADESFDASTRCAITNESGLELRPLFK